METEGFLASGHLSVFLTDELPATFSRTKKNIAHFRSIARNSECLVQGAPAVAKDELLNETVFTNIACMKHTLGACLEVVKT